MRVSEIRVNQIRVNQGLGVDLCSRVHISLDSLFSKILKKPSIVQKKMMPHMNGQHVSFEMKQKTKDNSEDWTPQ